MPQKALHALHTRSAYTKLTYEFQERIITTAAVTFPSDTLPPRFNVPEAQMAVIIFFFSLGLHHKKHCKTHSEQGYLFLY